MLKELNNEISTLIFGGFPSSTQNKFLRCNKVRDGLVIDVCLLEASQMSSHDDCHKSDERGRRLNYFNEISLTQFYWLM